jgi:hypothetical protein
MCSLTEGTLGADGGLGKRAALSIRGRSIRMTRYSTRSSAAQSLKFVALSDERTTKR